MPRIAQFDKLEVGDSPRVVGVVSSADLMRDPARLAALAAHVAEFRLDLAGFDPVWIASAAALRDRGIPVLLTIRSATEGGQWTGTDEDRLAAYINALPHVAAVDAEIASGVLKGLAIAARKTGRAVVASFHDFSGTPPIEELERIVARGWEKGADIVKVAVFTATEADLDTLKALLDRRAARPLSVLGMGPLGPRSRVELARAGSCLTYGFADASSAPGQVSSADLMRALG